MIFLTWRPQHLLLSLPTTRSATGQSKAWRMVLAYSTTSITLSNGMISGIWILINPSVGYFPLPEMLVRFATSINYPMDVQVKTMEAQKDLGVLEMELPSAGSLFEGQQDAWLYSEISFRHS